MPELSPEVFPVWFHEISLAAKKLAEEHGAQFCQPHGMLDVAYFESEEKRAEFRKILAERQAVEAERIKAAEDARVKAAEDAEDAARQRERERLAGLANGLFESLRQQDNPWTAKVPPREYRGGSFKR